MNRITIYEDNFKINQKDGIITLFNEISNMTYIIDVKKCVIYMRIAKPTIQILPDKSNLIDLILLYGIEIQGDKFVIDNEDYYLDIPCDKILVKDEKKKDKGIIKQLEQMKYIYDTIKI